MASGFSDTSKITAVAPRWTALLAWWSEKEQVGNSVLWFCQHWPYKSGMASECRTGQKQCLCPWASWSSFLSLGILICKTGDNGTCFVLSSWEPEDLEWVGMSNWLLQKPVSPRPPSSRNIKNKTTDGKLAQPAQRYWFWYFCYKHTASGNQSKCFWFVSCGPFFLPMSSS